MGPLVFWSGSIILGSMQPGYSSIKQTISALVLTPHGWLLTLNFCIFGYLVMLFALGLYFGIQKYCGLKMSVVLMFLMGCGFVVLGLCPTDPGQMTSIQGMVHHYTVYALGILFPLCCFLMFPSLKHDLRWRSLSIYTAISGIMVLFFIAGWIAMKAAGIIDSWVGLYERAFTANAIFWVEVMAIRLWLLPDQIEKTEKEIGEFLARRLNSEFWHNLGLSMRAISSIWKPQPRATARSERLIQASKLMALGALTAVAIRTHNQKKNRLNANSKDGNNPILSEVLFWGAKRLGKRMGLFPVVNLVSNLVAGDKRGQNTTNTYQ